MDLHESGEMYLETILTLKNKNQFVRSIDIANTMHFSKPSVSRAMKLLKESGYIIIDTKGYIELSEEGRKKAEDIYQRHLILTQLLKHIGVSEKQAEEDACRLEHVISDETYHSICHFLSKQS